MDDSRESRIALGRNERLKSRQVLQKIRPPSMKNANFLSKRHKVQQRSAGRRRTWAESSVFHGGVAGAISYASEHHDHNCPAGQLFTQVSPYKYDRQTSSGHKVFLPSVSNWRETNLIQN